MLQREDFIHFHMREGLRELGWLLLAGQYPNGSDDELMALSILDPLLARDRGPDPRRHSQNKLVPDLVALQGSNLLVVEAKPSYDLQDEAKLVTMAASRRGDFDKALQPFLLRFGVADNPSALSFLPCLAMSDGASFPRRAGFLYLFVSAAGETRLDLSGVVGGHR